MSRDYRLGVWGARADNRGLAIQTSEFCRWMQPDQILGIDLSGEYSPDVRQRFPSEWSGYDASRLTVADRERIKDEAFVKDWFSRVDVCWFAETAYTDEVWQIARDAGCRTVAHLNPEFVRFFNEPWLARPDLCWNPSPWKMSDLEGFEHVPFPVARDVLPRRHVEQARTFLHVVGRQAASDRAGTQSLARALRMIARPIRLVIRSQDALRASVFHRYARRDLTIDVISENLTDYTDLYADADVLIAPRRYGGQSLPMNEAASLGLPIITTDLPPQDAWVPRQTRAATAMRRLLRTQAGAIRIGDAHAQSLARIIHNLYDDPALVAYCSDASDAYAESISWEHWRPRFDERFAALARA